MPPSSQRLDYQGTILVNVIAEQLRPNQTGDTAQQERASTDTDRGPDSVLPML